MVEVPPVARLLVAPLVTPQERCASRRDSSRALAAGWAGSLARQASTSAVEVAESASSQFLDGASAASAPPQRPCRSRACGCEDQLAGLDNQKPRNRTA